MSTDKEIKAIEPPEISELVLKYFWGDDWLTSQYGDGQYPEWRRYNNEQKREVLELQKLINQAVAEELKAVQDKAEPFDVSPLTAAVPVSLIESRIRELEGK